jgi:ankyrin repeat protein
MLEDITETDREHARRLFHCLAVAVRPLCVEELAEILSFDFEEAQGGIPTFGRSENQIEAILSACSSLIAIVNDGDSRVVQFSNLSVKEFLTSDHLASSSGDLSRFQILPKAAHTIFAQVCLGSLLHLEDRVDKEGFKGLSLTQYAAQHWVTHAQFEGVASSVADGMQSLFDPDKPYFSAWVRTYDMDQHSDGTSQNEMPNPLYYAALCGFYDLVKHFAIKYPQHVDAIGGFYQFPLVAALCNKHLQVAGVLLEHGGTVDVRESGGETVLHKIIQLNGQNIDTVQFLLECGADVNARREDLSTPLHLAIVAGELNVARLLLEHNADVDPQNDKGLAPLHLLTRQELSTLEDIDSDLAVLLLESGANVNLQAKDNSTPLHLASYNQKFEIVQVLLDKGANADAENSEGRTPLQEVLRDDRPSIEDGADVAGILLERGADAYARDKYHVTSSDLAVCFGKDKTLPSLFGNNAAFSLANDRDKTAFHKWLKGGSYCSQGGIGVTHFLFC